MSEKKKGFILKKVRSHWCKQRCPQSSEERALQPARLWLGFKEEVESELSQEAGRVCIGGEELESMLNEGDRGTKVGQFGGHQETG